MPHPMFVAHCKRLEPLRAETLLDAAQAAISVHAPKEWWESLAATAQGSDRPNPASASDIDSDGFFRVNGTAVSLAVFKSNLSDGLGGGMAFEQVAA